MTETQRDILCPLVGEELEGVLESTYLRGNLLMQPPLPTPPLPEGRE